MSKTTQSTKNPDIIQTEIAVQGTLAIGGNGDSGSNDQLPLQFTFADDGKDGTKPFCAKIPNEKKGSLTVCGLLDVAGKMVGSDSIESLKNIIPPAITTFGIQVDAFDLSGFVDIKTQETKERGIESISVQRMKTSFSLGIKNDAISSWTLCDGLTLENLKFDLEYANHGPETVVEPAVIEPVASVPTPEKPAIIPAIPKYKVIMPWGMYIRKELTGNPTLKKVSKSIPIGVVPYNAAVEFVSTVENTYCTYHKITAPWYVVDWYDSEKNATLRGYMWGGYLQKTATAPQG